MGDTTQDSPNKVERADIGISLFSSNLLAKYFLWRKYLAPDSLWIKNKVDYWELEQAILYWAWSDYHQHLNSPDFGINRVLQAFAGEIGTLYNHKKAKLILHRVPLSESSLVQKLMGNIYRKGFASALFGKDHEKILKEREAQAQKVDDQKQVEAIVKWIEANYFEATNLFINDTGLIMGEVIHEMESISLNRVLFPTLYIFEPLVVHATLFLLVYGFVQNFIVPDLKSTPNELLKVYLATAVGVFILFSCKRLLRLIRTRF